MRIHTVAFEDFRNLENNAYELIPGLNILYGDNAQGKTNFLEAVYLCATGRSPRASTDSEMIRFGMAQAHIQTVTDEYTQIDMLLRRGRKKSAAINQLPVRRMSELFGNLLTVTFSPEDLNLIKSGPAERRHFMDIELCQLDKIYCAELQQDYRALKQRNNLLKAIRENRAGRGSLFVWDSQLAEHGLRISGRRCGFVENLSAMAADVHAHITGGSEKLEIVYRPNVKGADLEEKLKAAHDRDILTGTTSAGIHRDDLGFRINGEDCRVYGSQGQQRTASLSAKLAEVRLIRTAKGQSPVLLLDDVMSELDKGRQRMLMEGSEHTQVILTCTGTEDILRIAPAGTRVMRVNAGRIENAAD
jgi:DNA replication and repair protein RecF